jgi:hypothetical protein
MKDEEGNVEFYFEDKENIGVSFFNNLLSSPLVDPPKKSWS